MKHSESNIMLWGWFSSEGTLKWARDDGKMDGTKYRAKAEIKPVRGCKRVKTEEEVCFPPKLGP